MSHAIRHGDESEQRLLTVTVPDGTPVSQAVVEAVATVEGTEATRLSAQLYDSIDPEALDDLYETPNGRGRPPRVVFTFSGYEIAIAEECITVRERGRSLPSS